MKDFQKDRKWHTSEENEARSDHRGVNHAGRMPTRTASAPRFRPPRRAWFTIRRGILTEIYYPTVDRPQLRDIEFLFSDGNGFFLEEKRDLDPQIRRMAPSQGYEIKTRDRKGRFSLAKEIIVEPSRPCVLLHTQLSGDHGFLQNLKTYLLCAPHLEGEGKHNNAFVIEVSGRELLVAEKGNRWLVSELPADFPGSPADMSDRATATPISLTSPDGVRIRRSPERKRGADRRIESHNEHLNSPSASPSAKRFPMWFRRSSKVSACPTKSAVRYSSSQWQSAANGRKPLEKVSEDKGHLFEASYNLLLTHEDKLYQGAFVASLTIPWGGARDDATRKGRLPPRLDARHGRKRDGVARGRKYGRAAAGLDLSRRPAGRGRRFSSKLLGQWRGLSERNATRRNCVSCAAGMASPSASFAWAVQSRCDGQARRSAFLLHCGPVTGEERWEEAGGYSPSTLAAVIAAFICAASFARAKKKHE